MRELEACDVPHAGEQELLEVPHVGELEPTEVPHVGEPGARNSAADVQTALVRLGFRRDEARGAVQRAVAKVGATSDLETLLRAALRECPKPGS